MHRKTRIVLLLTVALFAASVVYLLFAMQPSSKQQVEIVQNGTVLYRLSLNEPQTLVIPSPDGTSSNVVCIENGGIRVSEAGCPDKTCVKMGVLKSEGLPIVCLPNQLVIRFCEE